jgi:hypothetical protein
MPRSHTPYKGIYRRESMEAARDFEYEGAPSSGTSGALAGYVEPGGLLYDSLNGVLFVNEGTLLSPYYTPVSFDQRPLFGVWTDFRDNIGKAHANTDAAAFVGGSGLRIFGQGVAETDSGVVVQAAGEGGKAGRLTTTDESAHTLAIGMDAGVMQPDQHQLLVIDARLTMVTALTDRALFCGFAGLAADALDPVVTGSTTTLTLVQDDLAGLFMDSGLTAASRLFAPHNKSDEAASIATTATGVDTGQNLAAAGTYARLRVEIDVTGKMRCFYNKVELTAIAASLDADEECSPVLYIGSNAAAVKAMDVMHFGAWAYR